MQYELNINKPDRQKAIDRFKKLLDEEATVELKKVVGRRSMDQNGWIHLLFTFYAIEYGYTKQEAKDLLKDECHFMSYKKIRNETGEEFIFRKQTSRLDKRECSEFIEWIYNYAGKNGFSLPSVEEYAANKSTYQELIRSCKSYL